MLCNPANADVLFPYLNGEDLNTHPQQQPSRWVINFFDWPLQRGAAGSWLASDEARAAVWLRTGIVPDDYPYPVATDYPDCLQIVRREVLPERSQNRNKQRREIWWRFTRPTAELYSAIAPLQRVLIVAQTSRTLAFAFVPKGWVYMQKIVVFAFGDSAHFASLQSVFHDLWARKYCSTLKQDLSYAPSDGFLTFPFPVDPRLPSLTSPGEAFHEHRRQIMLDRWEGLTKIYNRFHDAKRNRGGHCPAARAARRDGPRCGHGLRLGQPGPGARLLRYGPGRTLHNQRTHAAGGVGEVVGVES